jgi:glycosyltransferase involved in cell wall biosynthesis
VRVLVDATALPADRGGVGRYVDGLLGALTGDVVIVCQARDRGLFEQLAPAAELVPIATTWSSAPLRLLWEQFALPRLARARRADVIHSPHYTMPLLARMPVVVTFHDATFFSDPEVHSALKRVFFRSWIRVSSRRAAVIIVPSAATESELRRFVALDPTPVVVAHHGVDTGVFHPPTAEAIAEVRDLVGGSDWIGFLGTLEPRKNLPALVTAYARLARRGGELPVLALAGGAGWERQLDEAERGVTVPGRVVRLGFLPLPLLPAFLGGSELLVYPSLGEGFGLPVLEAMASGAAVLTTPRLALPEVGGDAVAYCEPDSASIETALAALLDDGSARGELRARGVVRAASFTWAASAERHLEAYRAAIHA